MCGPVLPAMPEGHILMYTAISTSQKPDEYNICLV